MIPARSIRYPTVLPLTAERWALYGAADARRALVGGTLNPLGARRASGDYATWRDLRLLDLLPSAGARAACQRLSRAGYLTSRATRRCGVDLPMAAAGLGAVAPPVRAALVLALGGVLGYGMVQWLQSRP